MLPTVCTKFSSSAIASPFSRTAVYRHRRGGETNVEQLIRLMVGRDVAFNRRPASETHHEDKPVRLAVKG
jgi:hypothetical protein